MSAEDRLLAATPILNFGHPSIEQLVAERGWKEGGKLLRPMTVLARSTISYAMKLPLGPAARLSSPAKCLADLLGRACCEVHDAAPFTE